MKSKGVVGTIVAGAAITAFGARDRIRSHAAEGTLPGRAGSWVNSYLGRPGYRLVADALSLGPEDELLDVACGWGEFLVVHGAPARRLAGIDRSAAKVALAQERLADRIVAGTADVVHGDAAVLPWGDETFSAVTCMDAFPFFTDPQRVLAEILRVLRPGGRMVMQIGMRWPDGIPGHLPHPTSRTIDVSDEDAVRILVENVGFSPVSFVYGPASAGRVGHFVDLRLMGSDELRLVKAFKPALA